jgi:cytochrome c-type biogenesis protein CcmH
MLSLGWLNTHAALNTYQFDDPVKKERFDELINELRCTVCQNQTIADSNADLAKDLRDKVYKMVQEGKTEQQIKDFMVARFTDFVLYNPPVKKSTYLLWTGPFILLGLGIIFLITYIRKRTQAPQVEIDEHQHQRVQALLKEQKDHNND